MTRHWIGCLLACALSLAVLAVGGLEPLERPLIDLRLRLIERPADPGPVLVEIDPRSIHEVGRWPWPRSLHALLLDRLTAAGAEDVFIDIDFSLRSDASEDAALEGALQRRQGAVTLVAFRQWSESAQAYVDAAPLPRFAQHARLASTNVAPAGDGLIRQLQTSFDWRESALPSFSASLAGVADDPQRSFYIDYGIDLSAVPRLSFVDVARGEVDPALLNGRRIVVGATAVELGDMLPVPIYRSLPGVAVQLLAAQSLMLDRALQRLPFWALAVAVSVFVIGLGFVARNSEPGRALTLVVGANVVLWGGAVGLQATFPIILDVVPFTLGSFGAGAIAILVRFRSVAIKLVAETLARRRTERFAGAVATNAFDAIVTTDGKGRINFVNSAASQMFGLSLAESQGRSVSQFIARAGGMSDEGVTAALKRVAEASRPRRLVCRRGNGEVFYADLTVSELIEEKRRLFILLVRDIDRRVKAERRLLARERDLRRAKKEAEVANQSKTEFLANMSHELKTPLNAIIGFSEIMASQLLGPLGTEGYLEYAKDIKESGQQLYHTVSDVLEFSRIDAGEVRMDEQEFDLVALCRQMSGHLQTRCEGSGHAFEAHLPPAEACYRGDERLVKIALNHVLSNAVKFTPSGGRVSFRLNLDDDGSARMVVEDAGIGIAENEIDHCFEAFGQANRGLQRTFEGSGLGLTLAKRFIELHQGTISLESEFGKGTKVTIILPATRSRHGAVRESA
ncbi:MAG: CHASE2 domain-containing protein [Kiloniellaceae bacterium]